MDFKEWLLFKAKNAGERSDLFHKENQHFAANIEAGKEQAYKEIAICKFMNNDTQQGVGVDAEKLCPLCDNTHYDFGAKCSCPLNKK